MVAYLAMLVGSFLQSPKTLQIRKNFLSSSLNIWNVSFKCKPLIFVKGFYQVKKIEDAWFTIWTTGVESRPPTNPGLISVHVKKGCVGRCGFRTWSRGGPASEIESCQCSWAESCEWSKLSVAGIQGPLKGPGSFLLKYAFSHILETLFPSFVTSTSTPKTKTSTFNLY